MFDHLDDANPVRADSSIRGAVANRSRTLRRQRQLMTAATALVVGVASVGVAFAVTRRAPKRTFVAATQTPTITTTTPPGPALGCGRLEPPAHNGVAQTATASLGSVTARLAGSAVDHLGNTTLAGARLEVTDGGRTVRNDLLAAPKDMPPDDAARHDVIPTAINGVYSATGMGNQLCVARFAGSDQPVVLVGLTTGGMHCCWVLQAFSLDVGRVLELDAGNTSTTLVEQPGGAIIETGDDSFNYTFTSYAGSATPLRVLEVRGDAFVDTTRQHPDLVETDLQRWSDVMNQPPQNNFDDIRGVLAARVADQCLLGRASVAFDDVGHLNAQGRLTQSEPDGWPQGSAYVTALRDFLSKHGYC
jgi:uncharacterized Zn-binding protein involved in type VI secretion